MMRALLVLLALGGFEAAFAHPHGGCGYEFHGTGYSRPGAYVRYIGYGWRSGARPYWHHPYYRRYAYMRPYLYSRLRSYGYLPYDGYCGSFYSYYPAYVGVAPVYTRLGVALTLGGREFDGPAAAAPGDRDGLPRARTELVGKRFLAKAP
jgi:hypothetical protein